MVRPRFICLLECMVMSLPEMDRLNFHRDECHDELAMTMAGKAAEIFKYGEDQVSNVRRATFNRPPTWRGPW